MSDGIRISYAYNPVTDKQISIAKAQKGIDYECVECGGKLRKRGGEGTYRREHFYHLLVNNCSITEESCLHNGSKLYLQECVGEGKSPVIFIKTEILPESELKNILIKAHVMKYQISAINFFENMMLINEVESIVDGSQYKGDLISRYTDGAIALVWEIRVSHPIEDNKRAWLDEHKIPYIELIPSESGLNDFEYEIVSYNNLLCFDVNNFSLEKLSDIYEKDINKLVKSGIVEYLKWLEQELPEIGSCGLAKELTECQKKFMKNFINFSIMQNNYKNCSKKTINEYMDLKTIRLLTKKFENGQKADYLNFNDIMPDSFTNLSGEFFNKLGERLGALGWINSENELCGIRFSYLDQSLKEHKILVTNKTIDLENGEIAMVNLKYLKFNEKNKRYELQENEEEGFTFDCLGCGAAISAPSKLLKDILEALIKEKSVIEIVVKPSNKYKKAVVGFNIKGMYPYNEYEWMIDDFLTPILKAAIGICRKK